MKKICYIVTIPGTIRSFFIPQLNYLMTKGYDVTVICNNDHQLANELGEKITFIPVSIPRGVSFFESIKAICILYNIFKKNTFDMVQYSTPNAAFYSSIAAKIACIPIRNYHCMGFRYLGFNSIIKFIFKLIERITCYCSTHVECVSESNLELAITENLFKREKGCVVFHGSTGGVDLNKFDINFRDEWRKEIRCKYNIKDHDFVYGFVGRVTRDKGINELLYAFSQINLNSKLLIVGSEENNSGLDLKLIRDAKENDSIIFVDNVNDVEKYFAAIDVLVLPTYREGFGNVIIEANALGTPVIVSNIPGPRDIIEEGINGYFVKPKNIHDLTDKMLLVRNELRTTNFTDNCYRLVREKYDSNILCQYIYMRKKELLNNE